MKRLFLVLTLAAVAAACTNTLVTYLNDVQFSISAVCSAEWLNPQECQISNDVLAVAIQAAQGQNAQANVKKALVDFEAALPAASNIRPYFDWLIVLL